MGKALILGLSMAFFVGYSLMANALGVAGTPEINPITAPQITSETASSQCEGDPRCDIPILGGVIKFVLGTGDLIAATANIFTGFYSLITFQAPGLASASLLTLFIFVPLGAMNAYIVFTAIRGSS